MAMHRVKGPRVWRIDISSRPAMLSGEVNLAYISSTLEGSYSKDNEQKHHDWWLFETFEEQAEL